MPNWAWSLLVGVSGLTFSGCLVAEPPDFGVPKKTPPRLDLVHAEPPITQILNVSTDETATREFKVPVRSEDLGDPLIATLNLNYNTRWAQVVGIANFLYASTFDDETREITVPWLVRASAGCQQLTLRVTHLSSTGPDASVAQGEKDIAIATWWLNVTDPTAPVPAKLDDCPANVGPVGTDGG
jgi:hypothetical protein